jgi:hypothetical protein
MATDNGGVQMSEYVTVSDISREVKQEHGVAVPPKTLSDLLYQRKVDVHACPVVAGRRLVPRGLVPAIIRALQERGLMISGYLKR